MRETLRRRDWVLVGLLALSSATARGEEAPTESPRIALCNPLGVQPGATTKLVMRGWKLDQAQQVRCRLEGATVKLLNQSNAPIPGGQDASQIGDTQVEIELHVPDELPAGAEIALVVCSPAGESAPFTVLAESSSSLVIEQEPNDGFRQAQAIQPLPEMQGELTIQGEIHADRNVDVFAFPALAGQTVRAEVFARRHGSALDSLLTLYDEQGQILICVDDFDRLDSRLEYEIPVTGRYFLALQDAHDHGGPAHPYRLVVTLR